MESFFFNQTFFIVFENSVDWCIFAAFAHMPSNILFGKFLSNNIGDYNRKNSFQRQIWLALVSSI